MIRRFIIYVGPNMPKAYWIACYHSISNPDAVAAYAKLAGPALQAAGERAFGIIRAAAERLAALAPPGVARPPALMMALHIWSMSHGVASLFARGDGARRKLPMSAEDLLEAEVLIYLRGLGFPTDRRKPREAHKPAGAPSGPWGTRST